MFQYCINKNEVREEDYPLLGGKAQAFAKLRDYNLPIPNWFVVKNEAFYSCLTEKQKKVLEHNDWKEAKKELENFELSETDSKARLPKEFKSSSSQDSPLDGCCG